MSGVIAKILEATSADDPELAELLAVEADGDASVLSPSQEYRQHLAEQDGLSGTDAYRKVVEDGDWAAVFFLDADRGVELLDELIGDDPQVKENLEPLAALGFTVGVDGDVARARLSIVTD